MDYLARLIAGANASPNKHKVNSPAERLQTTIKVCSNLRLLWQKGNVGPEDEAATARTAELLARLNSILLEESRKAAPHACLLHIVTGQIYIIVTKLALQSQDNHVIRVASQLYHVLINGEADGLLDNKLFSRSLLDLVRYTVTGPRVIVDASTEASLIELLFSICTKIRLDPDILPAWFHPERERSQARTVQGESRRSQFPLFYVLVQYVHHDGPVGDFARTGLLYLTETAAKFKALETWMIESDLAPQMASGLGALYSRLSRQFPAMEADEKALPILALSDLPETRGSPRESRVQFQQNMKEFLAYLAFWQDALNHCKSAEVYDTLLDHFQVLFVQQLLYPSLLESSDVDGGSTAAVIAHLTRILLAVDHPELARRMLAYLLASKTSHMPPEEPRKRRPRLSLSRRKSLDHLAALAEVAQSPSPDLFSLLDLIMVSLKSRHVNTVNGNLKLVAVIIGKQHQYALTGLFKVERAENLPHTPVETFTKLLIEYFDIAGAISAAETTLDESYQGALADTREKLADHSCARTASQTDHGEDAVLQIASGDKLMELLLNLLSTFFGNSTLTNLLLTETLLSLASCNRIDLYGWLLSKPETRADQSQTVTSVLMVLVSRVKQWASRFEDWEALIVKRRTELSFQDSVSAMDQLSTIIGPTQPVAMEPSGGSQADGSPRTSRPVTPRGRSNGSPAFGSIDGTLSTSPNLRSNLSVQLPAGSPLRQSYFLQDSNDDESAQLVSSGVPGAKLAELLATQLPLGNPQVEQERANPGSLLTPSVRIEKTTEPASSSSSRTENEVESGAETAMPTENPADEDHASLNHILTNAIILQEFILEVAAVIQVRGTMFGEVDIQS